MLNKLSSFFKKNWPIWLLLLIVFVLRIPNFSDPYWYGDEAIYLAVGNGINKGYKLYSEIIDHKTPLIYYLAMVPSQWHFRLLNLSWMMVTTIVFYKFAFRLFKNKSVSLIGSLIFVFLTSLPWFEGHIPNGELFVMGFVMMGLYVLSYTNFFTNLIEKKKITEKLKCKKCKEDNRISCLCLEMIHLYAGGVLVGLGMLTKVPALLDLAAILTVGWFYVSNNFLKNRTKKNLITLLGQAAFKILILMLGVLTPILISILYFVAIGSGKDYLDYGLLYNFRYSGSWKLDLGPSKLLAFLFTLPGKVLLMGGALVLVTLLAGVVTPIFQFLFSWMVLALFATLLSNRPYPHYFQQVVPPFSLLIVYLSCYLFVLRKKLAFSTKFIEIGLGFGLIAIMIKVMLLLNVALYPTTKYYSQYWKLKSGQISQTKFEDSFDSLVSDNLKVAQIVQRVGDQNLFIWGTNPMLYAQTKTVPSSRFTVSFHIKDFDAYNETFQIIQKRQPEMIIVMKNETTPFPDLEAYLKANYVPNYQFDSMTLYLRIN